MSVVEVVDQHELHSKLYQEKQVDPGANVIKLFTSVIYNFL